MPDATSPVIANAIAILWSPYVCTTPGRIFPGIMRIDERVVCVFNAEAVQFGFDGAEAVGLLQAGMAYVFYGGWALGEWCDGWRV